MTKNTFISTESLVCFIERCRCLSNEFISSIERIASFELANKNEAWKRAKIYNYISNSLLFFFRRVDFILICIKNEKINRDVLETIFRGILEIYCRVLFVLKSSEDEAIVKIIWQDLYVIGLSGKNILKENAVANIVKQDYKILDSLNIKMPEIDSLCENIQSRILNEDAERQPKKITKSMYKKLEFPGMKKLIMEYYDEKEEPLLPKYYLYRRYSEYSEQMHGNSIFELHGVKLRSDCRILLFLGLITLKFLKAISKRVSSEEEVTGLVDEFQKILPKLSKIGEFSELN